MKTVIQHIIICASVFIFYSCENFTFIMNVDCTQCVRVEPENVDATIELTYNDIGIPIAIYEGKYETGDLILLDTVYENEYFIELDVDKEYSITAEYKTTDRTILVIDNDFIEKRLASSECQLDCWVVLGGTFDLKLKY